MSKFNYIIPTAIIGILCLFITIGLSLYIGSIHPLLFGYLFILGFLHWIYLCVHGYHLRVCYLDITWIYVTRISIGYMLPGYHLHICYPDITCIYVIRISLGYMLPGYHTFCVYLIVLVFMYSRFSGSNTLINVITFNGTCITSSDELSSSLSLMHEVVLSVDQVCGFPIPPLGLQYSLS